MGKRHSKAAGFIPRFIIQRDEYAVRNGLSAARAIGCDEDGNAEIVTKWQGPEGAFRQIGLLRPRQFAPMRTREGLRIRKVWADGRLLCVADGSLEFITAIELPLSVEEAGDGIERSTFPADWRHDSRIAFHGREDALRAAGIIPFGASPWIRGARGGSRSGWKAELQPDGQIVHWVLRERRRSVTAVAVLPTAARPRLAENVIIGPWLQG